MAMNILSFIIFGLINGFIINLLESKNGKGSYLGAMSMGIFGALTGGMFALLIFGGLDLPSYNASLVSIVAIEGILLFLLFGKEIKKITS